MTSCLVLFAVLTAILVAFYFPFLTNHASFYVFDICALWQPWLTSIGERVRQGQLPLWNPYMLYGCPQIAVPTPTVFYPPNLLFAWLPFNPAYALLMIIHHIVAAVGMFLLVRSFGWGRLAAFTAGGAAALCGLMFSLQVTPTLMGNIGWSLIAWYLLRTSSVGPMRVAGCAMAVYLTITAGMAEFFVPALTLFICGSIIDFLQNCKAAARAALRLLLLRVAAIALGVVLAAPLLVPASEWSAISPRSIGLPLIEIFTWSCNWYELLCVAVMQPLGDLYVTTNPFRAAVATSGSATPYIANAFIGPVLLTFAVWALHDKTFKYRWCALAALVCAVILVLGMNVPALVWLAKIANLRMFRYPVKAMAFVTIALILISARGVTSFTQTDPLHGNKLASALWLIALVSGIVLFSQTEPISHLCGGSLIVSSIIGLSCAILGFLRDKYLLVRTYGAVIMITAAMGMFVLDAWNFNLHAAPADFYSKPRLVPSIASRLVKPQGSLRRLAVLIDAPTPTAAAMHNDWTLPNVYGFFLDMMAPQTNVPRGFADVYYPALGQTADRSILWRTATLESSANANHVGLGTLLQLGATDIAVTELGVLDKQGKLLRESEPLDPHFFTPTFVDPSYNLRIYAIRDPLPRAFFAPAVRFGAPHQALVDAVARPDQSGFDPHQLVILEHANSNEKAPLVSVSPNFRQTSSIKFVVDQPEYVRLEAATAEPNYLVLNDQNYPGWKASIDGAATQIYPANVLFRAVYVPAGKHQIEFRYQPESVRVGLVLQLIGIFVLLALFALSIRTSVARPR